MRLIALMLLIALMSLIALIALMSLIALTSFIALIPLIAVPKPVINYVKKYKVAASVARNKKGEAQKKRSE